MWDGLPPQVVWDLFQSLVLPEKGLAQRLVPLVLLPPCLVFLSQYMSGSTRDMLRRAKAGWSQSPQL